MIFVLSFLFAALASADRTTIDDYANNFIKQSRVPGLAVLVADNGEPPVTACYGLADVATKKQVEPGMVFDSGSMGKMFTATVVLKLAEKKLLSLDDRLGKYVTEVPDEWERVTLRQMLSHTSGLPEYVLYEGITLMEDFDGPKWFDVMKDKKLDFEPGGEFQYSNTNFFMAMLMAERASHKEFMALVGDYVFKPAGMRSTGPLKSLGEKAVRATGYWVEQEIQPIGPGGNSPDHGSGGHFTTVGDIKKFSDALFGGKLLSPKSLELMTTPASLPEGRKAGYGLGMFLRKVNGVDIWSHGGNSVGYAGSLTYIPSKKLTIVLLGNAYQMNGDGTALGLARAMHADLRAAPLVEQPEPDESRRAVLLRVLRSLGERKIDDEALHPVMKRRLSTPRGQMGLAAFAPMVAGEFEAYLGSETVAPDTLVRYRVKAGERKFVAVFTVTKDGKVFTVSLSPA